MSSLAQRVKAATPDKKPNLAEWLESLDADDLKEIEDAGRTWARSALEKFIREEGVAVSDVSLVRWIGTL